MRKLYLASVKFKVGNNEFEETRLVASSEKRIEDVSDDAKIAWKHESKGTEREMISITISDTLTVDKSDEIRKPEVKGDLVKPLELKRGQIFEGATVYWLIDSTDNTDPREVPAMSSDLFAKYLYEECKSGRLTIVKN